MQTPRATVSKLATLVAVVAGGWHGWRPMRRSERVSWILKKIGDLALALLRGDRVAVALLIALISGAILYWVVTRRRDRGVSPGFEERWVVPDAEEVARLIRPARDGSSDDRNRSA